MPTIDVPLNSASFSVSSFNSSENASFETAILKQLKINTVQVEKEKRKKVQRTQAECLTSAEASQRLKDKENIQKATTSKHQISRKRIRIVESDSEEEAVTFKKLPAKRGSKPAV